LAKTGITHLSAGVPISASASLVQHTVQALHNLRGFVDLIISDRQLTEIERIECSHIMMCPLN
jgi:hypothetical protein